MSHATAQVPKVRKRPALAPRFNNEGVNTAELKSSIGFSLRRAQLSTYSDFLHFMKRLQVRPSQFAVLVLIHSNRGISPSVLSFTLGIQKANFVSFIDELASRGLVERRRLPQDRRAVALHLTRRGETFTKKIQAAHAKLEKALATRLGPRDSALFLGFLNRFADAAHPEA